MTTDEDLTPTARSHRPYLVPSETGPRGVSLVLTDQGVSRDEIWKSVFLPILKNGLPEPKTPAKVIVVGGGIAGLCTARELLRAGYDVTILESSQRIGGRIFSVRGPFTDNLWGEAGAMRIPPIHFLVHAYAQLLNVAMELFNNNTDEAYYFFDEPDIPQKLVKLNDKPAMEKLFKYWEETLGVPRESLPIGDKFKRTMSEIRKEIDDQGYENVVAKYDPMSFRELLLLKGWSEQEILLLSLTSTEESYMSTGAVENFEEFVAKVWDDDSEYPDPFDPSKTIRGLREFVGSMEKFPEAFADEKIRGKPLRDRIWCGQRVYRLDLLPDAEGKVTVFHNREAPEATKCDYVVLAVPLTVLRNIETTPIGWSVGKQKAIREFAYAPSGKIFLEYRKQWWLEPPYNMPADGGGGAFTSRPIRQVYFPSKRHSDFAGTDHGVIIASYTWEQDTLVWGAMSPEGTVAEAVRQVDEIFPGSREHYVTGCVWNWHLDPNAGGGAFAYLLPGQWTRLFHDVIKPDGVADDPRFFFAGEHASPIHSWIEGALDSALFAALHVHKRHMSRS